MKIFGKHVTAAFNVSESAFDCLIGIQVSPGECECCNAPVTVTRIGIGVAELDIFVQENH